MDWRVHIASANVNIPISQTSPHLWASTIWLCKMRPFTRNRTSLRATHATRILWLIHSHRITILHWWKQNCRLPLISLLDPLVFHSTLSTSRALIFWSIHRTISLYLCVFSVHSIWSTFMPLALASMNIGFLCKHQFCRKFRCRFCPSINANFPWTVPTKCVLTSMRRIAAFRIVADHWFTIWRDVSMLWGW